MKRFFNFKKYMNTGKKIINDTYAEINLRELKNNFLTVKKLADRNGKNGTKICSIIKANAYGHGMNETGKALSEFGSDYLGTADYSESVILRNYLKKHSVNVPILCLGILTEKGKFFEEIISHKIEVTLADLKTALYLNNFAKSRNKKINVQLQVDSGINRIGFNIRETYEAFSEIKKLGNLNIKGVYSHYATSEIPCNSYALQQFRNFKSLLKEIEHNLGKIELRHISNSGGIMNYPDPYFNMVRPGISLYGYYPDRKMIDKTIGIIPVMTFKSKISFIKELEKNQSISYGRNFITKRKTRIASIPVGYGDGYPRLLTNKSKVKINGKLYKTVGTVCMDWIMADIGLNSGVKVNDEVILFGKDYPADILSEMTGTIPYEITCNISSRVQRVYVK